MNNMNNTHMVDLKNMDSSGKGLQTEEFSFSLLVSDKPVTMLEKYRGNKKDSVFEYGKTFKAFDANKGL